MNEAIYVYELPIVDPDTHNTVMVAMYKDQESGGIFGIDCSYILTLDDEEPVINPFSGKEVLLIGD